MEKCSDFLEEHLDVDNCLEIKDFANFQVGCEKLRLAAEAFAGKAFSTVHKTPKTIFIGSDRSSRSHNVRPSIWFELV